jgi:magnesium chelatase accessory protein
VTRPGWTREGRDWPHREASSFVEAGGVTWHVQRMGAGPPVLLLHGTGAATHSWRGLMPLLAEHFSVVAIDLPGHGFTSAPRAEGYTLPAMARSVAALLHTLDAQPSLMIGHSAGAAIAARLAVDATFACPIVSINGALLPFPGAARLIFPAIARALVLNPFVPRLFALQGQSRTLVARFLVRNTGSRIDEDGARLYQSLFACSGHCAGALAMMANWDLDALERELPALPVPMLLLAGQNDAAVPHDVATRVGAGVPNGEARVLATLGHLAHEEAPDRIADAVLAFARAHAILPAQPERGRR